MAENVVFEITGCPNCKKKIRVPDAVAKRGSGKIRCGNCGEEIKWTSTEKKDDNQEASVKIKSQRKKLSNDESVSDKASEIRREEKDIIIEDSKTPLNNDQSFKHCDIDQKVPDNISKEVPVEKARENTQNVEVPYLEKKQYNTNVNSAINPPANPVKTGLDAPQDKKDNINAKRVSDFTEKHNTNKPHQEPEIIDLKNYDFNSDGFYDDNTPYGEEKSFKIPLSSIIKFAIGSIAVVTITLVLVYYYLS